MQSCLVSTEIKGLEIKKSTCSNKHALDQKASIIKNYCCTVVYLFGGNLMNMVKLFLLTLDFLNNILAYKHFEDSKFVAIGKNASRTDL